MLISQKKNKLFEIDKEKLCRKDENNANQFNPKNQSKENKLIKEQTSNLQTSNITEFSKDFKDQIDMKYKELRENKKDKGSIELQKIGTFFKNYSINTTEVKKWDKEVNKNSFITLSTKHDDQPKVYKTQTTKGTKRSQYEKKVASLSELDFKDKLKFITTPPPIGKIVQVSIIKEKGFMNTFHQKYHVSFSVV